MRARDACLNYLASRRARLIGGEMAEVEGTGKLELVYTLLCDDVRLEVGNKLSFMGVFQNIIVQQMPVRLFKFAVVNHWQGEGQHLSEVRKIGRASCRERV